MGAQFQVEQLMPGHWRTAVGAFRLEAKDAKKTAAGVRATVSVHTASSLVHLDVVSLTSRSGRLRFLDGLSAVAGNGTPISEPVLMALGQAIGPALAESVEGASPEDNGRGQKLVFEEIEPWPEDVDGAALLDEVSVWISRHAILPEGGADALALWIAHTYAMDAWCHSPFFTIHSPLKRCGKSTLLKIAKAFVHRPIPTANISQAALFRIIEQSQPTLLLDEAQTWIDDANSELTGILQAGHAQETAYVVRCKETADGQDVVRFSTWAPKLVCLVGNLPDMMMDRSIVVRMRRRLRSETIEPLRERTLSHVTQGYRSRLLRFVLDAGQTLREYEAEPIDGLSDRAMDNWTPLFALAQAAGRHWPAKARAAARRLSGGAESSEDSPGLALLADMRAIFDEIAPETSISSANAVERLKKIEDRPWADLNRGNGITTNWVAKRLGEFDVPKPVQIRFAATGQQLRGYHRDWFSAPWERYLDLQVSQCHTGNKTGAELAISKRHSDDSVTLTENEKRQIEPMKTGLCDTVTLQRPLLGVGRVVQRGGKGVSDVERF